MTTQIENPAFDAKMRTGRRTWHLLLRGGPFLLLFLLVWAPAGAQHRRLKLVNVPGRFYRTMDRAGRLTTHPQQAVAGRLIVRLRPGVGAGEAEAVARRLGGRVRKFLPRLRMAFLEIPESLDLAQAQMLAAVAPEVEFAEPDVLVYPADVPGDPRYADQWHHPLIRCPEGWDVTEGRKSTLIAVIDSGCDMDHRDLEAKYYTNPNEIPKNGKDDDGNGYIDDVRGWDFYDNNNNPNPSPDGKDNDGNGEPDDQVTHGTLVAGLAAAAANGFGTVGVDWRAQILPLQVFPDDGGTAIETVIDAMAYAVDMGADVINLSLGSEGFWASFNAPIEAAYQAGVTVVAAAGNSDQEFTTNSNTWASPVCNDGPNPAVDNYVLGVGATDKNDIRAPFSNFDSSGWTFIDVSAPGQAVFGPGYFDPAFPHLDGQFALGNGTSFAAPIVAGLCGLVKAQNPGITHAGIIEQIRQATDNIDRANPGFAGKLGTGRINAATTLGLDLPPQPVRNLKAEDTKHDEGGSITLAWSLSNDDGSGARDVEAYIVKRARGQTGTYRVRATIPPGTKTYEDTPATDGVRYYYTVTTRDVGGKTTDSEIAGPAVAADDSAPPQVTGVAANDEPGDGGGALRVAWDPYAPPPDFVEFRIYRADFGFISVQGMTPIATLTDVATTSYLDTSTVDGVDYWYAVTAVDGVPNELTDVVAAGPVQSFPNQGLWISKGLHFLATPIIPDNRDPAALLGLPPQDLQYARWDPTAAQGAGAYLFYHVAPQDPLLAVGLARGFWFGAPSELTVDPVGDVAPSGPFVVELEPGWHQLGNPFLGQFDFTQSTVEHNGVTMDLASAEAAGIMQRFAWVYNAVTQDYELIDRAIAGQQRLILPWQGFWVLVLKPCRLTFTPQTGAATLAVAETTAEQTAVTWQAQLIACAAGGADAANYFGVGTEPDRLNVQAPPSFGRAIELSLLGASGDGTPYAAVFRRSSAREPEWEFTVRTSVGGDVTISAPDLSAVPADRRLLLTDLDVGRSVELRTVHSYRYTAPLGDSTRRFRLQVRKRTNHLVVTSLSSLPTRNGGAEIRFVLTADAACDVSVMNIAGRPVRRIVRSRLHPAGQQVILWDGQNDGGVPVPAGRYLIRVRANSADGETSQALSSAFIRR